MTRNLSLIIMFMVRGAWRVSEFIKSEEERITHTYPKALLT